MRRKRRKGGRDAKAGGVGVGGRSQLPPWTCLLFWHWGGFLPQWGGDARGRRMLGTYPAEMPQPLWSRVPDPLPGPSSSAARPRLWSCWAPMC